VHPHFGCIVVSLIFYPPYYLVCEDIEYVVQCLVELDEDHEGDEISLVIEREAYEDLMIVADDAVKVEHYGCPDRAECSHLQVVLILEVSELMSDNWEDLIITERLLSVRLSGLQQGVVQDDALVLAIACDQSVRVTTSLTLIDYINLLDGEFAINVEEAIQVSPQFLVFHIVEQSVIVVHRCNKVDEEVLEDNDEAKDQPSQPVVPGVTAPLYDEHYQVKGRCAQYYPEEIILSSSFNL
jgi:hypothetical protein